MKLNVKLMLLFMVGLLLQSCLKDEIAKMDNGPEVDESEVLYSSDFNWKTTKEVSFSVLPNANSVVYLKSESGNVYHKQYITSGDEVEISFTVPTYETDIVVELSGQKERIELSEELELVKFN